MVETTTLSTTTTTGRLLLLVLLMMMMIYLDHDMYRCLFFCGDNNHQFPADYVVVEPEPYTYTPRSSNNLIYKSQKLSLSNNIEFESDGKRCGKRNHNGLGARIMGFQVLT